MVEALPVMLKELRLPAFGQHYPDYQEQAIAQSWGYSQFLAKLCEQEVAQRYQIPVKSIITLADLMDYLPQHTKLAPNVLSEMQAYQARYGCV